MYATFPKITKNNFRKNAKKYFPSNEYVPKMSEDLENQLKMWFFSKENPISVSKKTL